jgi:hypothetical protein
MRRRMPLPKQGGGCLQDSNSFWPVPLLPHRLLLSLPALRQMAPRLPAPHQMP